MSTSASAGKQLSTTFGRCASCAAEPAVMAAVLVVAALLRLPALDARPMHCDEAVHAVKLGEVLESGAFVYDPHEYHGPTLAYLSVPIAWIAGAQSLPDLTEALLRLVPAIAGIGLVALVWLLRDELGRTATFAAATLTAVSPAMVFYSRYYIQEMLLVCFTFAAIVAMWRWWREASRAGRGASGESSNVGPEVESRPPLGSLGGLRREWPWLVMLGVSLGLMHATKETCVIAWFAMAMGLAGVMLLGWRPVGAVRRNAARQCNHRRVVTHLAMRTALVLVAAAVTSGLFYSAFLRHPSGIVDSVTAFAHYLDRAGGEGSAGPHDYPWYRYLQWLFWWSPGERLWTEGAVAVLTVVGGIGGFVAHRQRGFSWLPAAGVPLVRFLAIYTVVLLGVYSAISYKTPWCALGFLHGMILLAGVGAATLIGVAPGRTVKVVAGIAIFVAVGQLVWQAHRTSFTAAADPNNPYVYAHTTRAVPRLADRVGEIASTLPEGRNTHVQVFCPDADYWPLPWYLRDMPRVGYFSATPDGPPAPIIIAQPTMERELLRYLFKEQPPGKRRLYVPIAADDDDEWSLRPHVPLRLYVRLDVLDSIKR